MGCSKTKLPTKLPKETLFWSTKLPGQGSSSPVIWNDKLFITSENRAQKNIRVVCLDALLGKTLWTQSLKVGESHLHRFNNAAASTPVVSAEHVAVAWFDGVAKTAMLTTFDHSGKKLWEKSLGSYESQHGFCLNPVIHKDVIFVAPLHQGEGSVVAISLHSGEEKWKRSYRGSKTSYVEVSRNDLNPNPGVTHTDATPAIAHDRLYLRVGDRLDCHGTPQTPPQK